MSIPKPPPFPDHKLNLAYEKPHLAGIKLGAKVRVFDQYKDNFGTLLDQKNSGGICRQLSIEWLSIEKSRAVDYMKILSMYNRASFKDMKTGGLAEWMFKDDSKSNAVSCISQESQINQINLDLKKWGLNAQAQTFTDAMSRPPPFKPVSVECSTWIFAARELRPYRVLFIMGEKIGHALAINLTSGREAFFDPNLGEFRFHGKFMEMQKFIMSEILPTPPGCDGAGNYLGNEFVYYQMLLVTCN